MNSQLKKTFIRYLILTIIYGTLYMFIEAIWKGGFDRLHWSMFVLAAVGGITVGQLNNRFTYEMDILIQCIIGGIIATLGEGLVGHVFNSDYSCWDYRTLPLTFWNAQINLFFSLAWAFILCPLAILIDDTLDYYLFQSEERPYYKLFGRVLFYLPERRG